MPCMILALLCLVSMVAQSILAVHHRVGDYKSGWSQATDLTGWASNRTFMIGDALEFKYGRAHGVQVVSQDDYVNCNTNNSGIIIGYTGGIATFSLDQTGPMYFICPTSGHCQAGMKLAINVVAGGSGSGSGSIGPIGGEATRKLSGGLVLISSLVAGALFIVFG